MSTVLNKCAIDNDFANVVTSAPGYCAGEEITVAIDGALATATYKYIKAAANLTAYQPYVLVNGAEDVTTASPATSSVTKIVGIPQTDIASGSYGWVAIGGVCKAKTGIQAKGDTLEVLNSGTTLVVDGSSGSPAETAGTVAISAETAAAAATVKVNLLNKRVTIAAS